MSHNLYLAMFIKLYNNANYKLNFPNFIFQKESLKNRLWNTLKEPKTSIINEEGVEWSGFGTTEINWWTCNVKCIEKVEKLMEGTTNLSYHSSHNLFLSLTPSSTSDETTRSSSIPHATSTSTSIERPMTKVEILQS